MTTRTSQDLFMGLQALTDDVRGPVLVPDDDEYASETATWNVALQHRPLLAVGATCAEDVMSAVRFAGAYDLPVAVVATGHGAVVSADGAVLITTRRMNGVRVNQTDRTVRIEAGAQWQDVVKQTAAVGLAPLAGSSPSVGAVGYTLGGGLSPLMGRKYGFAADHVRSIEVVTADGRLRRVSAQDEPDLFWALLGGKGNFGVVTAIVCGLFPVSSLYGGGLFFSAEHARDVVRAYQELTTDAPDELSSSFAFMRLPDVPFVPEFLRGTFVVHVRIAYLGTVPAGDALVARLRSAAPPMIDTLAEMPLADYAQIHSDPEGPLPAQDRSSLLYELPDAAVDALFDIAGPDADYPITMVEVRHLGGALGREPRTPNAVGNRGARFQVASIAISPPGTEQQLTALQERLIKALQPWSVAGGILNFLGHHDATVEGVRAAFEPAAYQRLAGIKHSVDPKNIFRINHNIPPQAPAPTA